ncbi:hypothetical protein L1887_38162 [Cichorium endivia]|nr:hypothetical protein L1887_38162 [Cichorium endivia]
MASRSSSSNQHVTLEVEEEHPYQCHACAPNFVTVKLSGKDKFQMWKTQMLCMLESYGMLGFIHGTPKRRSGKAKAGDNYSSWRRSNAQVKGWILGSLTEDTLRYVLNRLGGNADFSAKDVWDELLTIYGPVLPQLVVVDEKEDERKLEIEILHQRLRRATQEGDWTVVDTTLSTHKKITVVDKITGDGNTALHLAVGTTKNRNFLMKILGRIPDNTNLLNLRNSDGSTLLHVAAIVGNTEAAEILVERNRDLLLAKDNEDQEPLLTALSSMHTEMFWKLLNMNSDIENDTLFSGTSGDKFLTIAISSKDFRLAYDLVRHYKTLHGAAVLMAIAQNFSCELTTFERYMGTNVLSRKLKFVLKRALDHMVRRCGPKAEKVFGVFYYVWPFIKKRVGIYRDAMRLVNKVCELIKDSNDPNSHIVATWIRFLKPRDKMHAALYKVYCFTS